MKPAFVAVLCAAFASVAVAQSAVPNPLTTSRVFAYGQTPSKTAPNGAVGRNFFTGTLATGEAVAAHETMQPTGTIPNPAHRIQHSELIVVRERNPGISSRWQIRARRARQHNLCSVRHLAFCEEHRQRSRGVRRDPDRWKYEEDSNSPFRSDKTE